MQDVESSNTSCSRFSVEVLPGGKTVFSKEDNLLLVKGQTEFTVAFNITDTNVGEESEDWAIWVKVMYSDPVDVARHGPVVPCSCLNHANSRSKPKNVYTYKY